MSINHLAKKDLLLLWRDKMGAFWTLGFPLLMALFFGSLFSGAGGSSAGHMAIGIVNEAGTPETATFVKMLRDVEVLEIQELDAAHARDAVRQGKLTAFIRLKKGFGTLSGLFNQDHPTLQVVMDPSHKMEGQYLKGILMQKSFELLQKTFQDPDKSKALVTQGMESLKGQEWSDPEQKKLLEQLLGSFNDYLGGVDRKSYAKSPEFQGPAIAFSYLEGEKKAAPLSAFEITFPQGIFWGLIAVVLAFAISLVVEFEQGTFIRLQMAPLSANQILTGKALGCFIACLIEVVLLLFIGKILFHVRFGNILHLGMAVTASSLAFVGMMIFIANLGRTERAVSGAGWAIMLIMAMTGGGMIPLMVMPGWMVKLSSISPIKWGILATEGAIWRNFSTAEMLLPCGILLGVFLFFYTLGYIMFRRRSGARS